MTSPHLSDESLLEVAEGGGSGPQRAHAASCQACGARVAETREALTLAQGASAPEPPGAYWPAMRRAVSRRIDAQPRRSASWGWLLPLAGAAAAAAVALSPLQQPADGLRAPAVALPAWSALPPIEEDAALPVLEQAVAEDEPVLASVYEGRGLGAFVAGLTDEEAQTLAERLRRSREEGEL